MARTAHANFLISAEHIGGGVPASFSELDSPAWRGYDVLTHTPPTREWTDALHQRGIKSMPYLTLCYQYMHDRKGNWNAADTPEVIIIDKIGRPQIQSNYHRHDGRWVYEICANTRKARDLYLREAEKILKAGCDGIFLDNAAPSRKCYGPQFGQHEHIHAGDPSARAKGHLGFCYPKAARKYRLEVPVADEEQTYATAMLIREIRDLARSYHPDNRIMINGGDGSGTPPLFFDQVDSVMNEMFIYTTYLDYNYPSPTHLDYQDHTPLDWLNVLAWQEQFTQHVRMNCLSAYSPHDPYRRRHAVFAFCAAKLWDALVYTTADLELDAWLREIRLGAPLTDGPGTWGAVFYREFEGGLVCINPYGAAQEAVVPWTNKPAQVAIHGDLSPTFLEEVNTADGTMTLELQPDRAAILLPGA